MSLRDFLILTSREICNNIKQSYQEFLNYKNKSLSLLVKDFTKSDENRQRKILTLFLMGDEETKFNATIIFDLISNSSNLVYQQNRSNIIYDSYIIK